jgi:hypothetical protein
LECQPDSLVWWQSESEVGIFRTTGVVLLPSKSDRFAEIDSANGSHSAPEGWLLPLHLGICVAHAYRCQLARDQSKMSQSAAISSKSVDSAEGIWVEALLDAVGEGLSAGMFGLYMNRIMQNFNLFSVLDSQSVASILLPSELSTLRGLQDISQSKK